MASNPKMNCDSGEYSVESDNSEISSESRGELQTKNNIVDAINDGGVVSTIEEHIISDNIKSCFDAEVRKKAESEINEIIKTDVVTKRKECIKVDVALETNKDTQVQTDKEIETVQATEDTVNKPNMTTVQTSENFHTNIPEQTDRNMEIDLGRQISQDTDTNQRVKTNDGDEEDVEISNNEKIDADVAIFNKSKKPQVNSVPVFIKKEIFQNSALYRLSDMYPSDTDSEDEHQTTSNVTSNIEAECVSPKSPVNVTTNYLNSETTSNATNNDLQCKPASPTHSANDIKVLCVLPKPISCSASSVQDVCASPMLASTVTDSNDESSSSSDSDSSLFEDLTDSEDSEEESAKENCEKSKTKSSTTIHPIKAKGELTVDDLPRIEDLHISVPETSCKELGKVYSIVQTLVVVQPDRSMPTLNLDTVLFLDKGKRALGHIFDVFGKVSEPYYCVRFNSTDHIKEFGIEIGTIVYCAPMNSSYTHYVFLKELRTKGCDASWKADMEPPENLLEYSDDEEERRANMNRRHQKKNASQNTSETPPSKKINISSTNSNYNFEQNGTSAQTYAAISGTSFGSKRFNDNSGNSSRHAMFSSQNSNARSTETQVSVKIEPFETQFSYNRILNNDSPLQQHANISPQFRTDSYQFGGKPNFGSFLKPPGFYVPRSFYNGPPPSLSSPLHPRPEHVTPPTLLQSSSLHFPPPTPSLSSPLHPRPEHLTPPTLLQSSSLHFPPPAPSLPQSAHFQSPPSICIPPSLLPSTRLQLPPLSQFSLTPIHRPPPHISHCNVSSSHNISTDSQNNISHHITSISSQSNIHSTNSDNDVFMFTANTPFINDRSSIFQNAANKFSESHTSTYTQNMFQPSTNASARKPSVLSHPQNSLSHYANSSSFSQNMSGPSSQIRPPTSFNTGPQSRS